MLFTFSVLNAAVRRPYQLPKEYPPFGRYESMSLTLISAECTHTTPIAQLSDDPIEECVQIIPSLNAYENTHKDKRSVEVYRSHSPSYLH